MAQPTGNSQRNHPIQQELSTRQKQDTITRHAFGAFTLQPPARCARPESHSGPPNAFRVCVFVFFVVVINPIKIASENSITQTRQRFRVPPLGLSDGAGRIQQNHSHYALLSRCNRPLHHWFSPITVGKPTVPPIFCHIHRISSTPDKTHTGSPRITFGVGTANRKQSGQPFDSAGTFHPAKTEYDHTLTLLVRSLCNLLLAALGPNYIRAHPTLFVCVCECSYFSW